MIFSSQGIKEIEMIMKEVARYNSLSAQEGRKALIERIHTSCIFRNGVHKDKFLLAVCDYTGGSRHVSNQFLAALYLLTASEQLWKVSRTVSIETRLILTKLYRKTSV